MPSASARGILKTEKMLGQQPRNDTFLKLEWEISFRSCIRGTLTPTRSTGTTTSGTSEADIGL